MVFSNSTNNTILNYHPQFKMHVSCIFILNAYFGAAEENTRFSLVRWYRILLLKISDSVTRKYDQVLDTRPVVRTSTKPAIYPQISGIEKRKATNHSSNRIGSSEVDKSLPKRPPTICFKERQTIIHQFFLKKLDHMFET